MLLSKQETEQQGILFGRYENLIQSVCVLEDKENKCSYARRQVYKWKHAKINDKVWAACIIGATLAGGTLSTEILPMVVCAVTGTFVPRIIFRIIKTNMIERKQQRVSEVEREYDEYMKSIASEISCIPKGYMSSYALQFFVNEYNSGRVNTVLDAIKSYDAYCHRMKVEKQNEQLEKRYQILVEQNREIIRNQEDIEAAIDAQTNAIFWYTLFN